MTNDANDSSLPTLSLLILARLLQPATADKTRDDVGRIAAARLGPGEWATAFDAHWRQLCQAGLIGPKPAKKPGKTFTLTDAGQQRALAFLKSPELPAKLTWSALQADYLLPLAMKLRPGSAEARRLSKAAPLKLAVIARSKGLALAEGAKAKTMLAAVAWQLIGVESDADFTAENVIQQLAFQKEPGKKITPDQMATTLATAAVRSRNTTMPELRLAAIRQWLLPAPAAPVAPAARPNLPAFAEQVLNAARRCPAERRFGDNKVFISHIWHELHGQHAADGVDLEAFKRRLIDANRDGLLQLSRADLVEAMDPNDVGESATVFDNAVFHFVRI
jgi:hypothetical protein